MKRKWVWIREYPKGYAKVLGYYIGDGLLAVYHNSWDHDWTVMHVPTGYSFKGDFESFKEAKSFAVNIRKIDPFDWFAIDEFDMQLSRTVVNKFMEVGYGRVSPDDFNVWAMKVKMGVGI